MSNNIQSIPGFMREYSFDNSQALVRVLQTICDNDAREYPLSSTRFIGFDSLLDSCTFLGNVHASVLQGDIIVTFQKITTAMTDFVARSLDTPHTDVTIIEIKDAKVAISVLMSKDVQRIEVDIPDRMEDALMDVLFNIRTFDGVVKAQDEVR